MHLEISFLELHFGETTFRQNLYLKHSLATLRAEVYRCYQKRFKMYRFFEIQISENLLENNCHLSRNDKRRQRQTHALITHRKTFSSILGQTLFSDTPGE